jgi:carbamoyltransferase
VATHYVRHYVQQTGIDTVVLSGGVVANVKMNQRIFEISEVRRIFIYPNMGDGGCGTGAAFLVSQQHLQEREAYQAVYFGPDYSDDLIASELQAAGLTFEHVTPIEPVIARLMHAAMPSRVSMGGWNMAAGAGNRSILIMRRAGGQSVVESTPGPYRLMPFINDVYEERHRC